MFTRAAGPQSKKKSDANTKEEQPARALPGGSPTHQQRGAIQYESENSGTREQEWRVSRDGEDEIPDFEKSHRSSEPHPECIFEDETSIESLEKK